MLNVVVCNYRTPADLEAFLASFDAHPPAVEHDLTIVNVAPLADDTRVGLSHGSRYIEFPDNVGYGRACNAAATNAEGDVLVFFNADVRVIAGALDRCYEALLSEPAWGVLGPRQVDDDGRLTHAGIFGTHAAPRHRGWRERDVGQHLDIRPDAVTVSGAAYFVRRDAWAELASCPKFREASPGVNGAFLQTPFGWEETWVSYHAHAHGWAVTYYGPVTLVHNWHRAVVADGRRVYDRFPESQRMFREACDHHGIPHD